MLPRTPGIRERFQFAKEAGFEAIKCPTTPDAAKAEEMLAASNEAALPIHSVMNSEHWNSPLSSADPAVVEKSLEGMRTSLRNAKLWGADTVLLVPAVVNPQTSYAEAWERSQRQIRKPTLQQQIESAPYTTNSGDSWLKFGAFKLILDGGMTIGTAYQRHPYGPFGKQLYGKTDPDDRGQRFVAPDKLLAVMRTARSRGWQLTTHDQGGGAVDTFLDTLEALDREKPIAPTRSHLIHASFQSPEAIARMKRMGILADVQAAWLYLDAPALEQVFGYDGMRYFYPLRSYIDAGIVIMPGLDCHTLRCARTTSSVSSPMEPAATRRPLSRMQNSLATRRANGSFCSTSSTVSPSSLFSFKTMSPIS